MYPKIYRLASILVLTVLTIGCARSTVTATIQPSTPTLPSSTNTVESTLPLTETPTLLPTIQTGCTDSALYVKDVSIPDNTKLKAGEAFTKTWQLRNTGTCIWNVRYALVFVGGEQMVAAITTPLSETPPSETLDISVDLVAPAKDGAYTGLFELRNPKGRALDIGSVTSIWVKITVGNVSIATPPALTTAPVTPVTGATDVPGKVCKPQQNIDYIAQLLALINNARAEAKLASLNISGQLSTAAQGHSDDMACNNFVGHSGFDGSSIQSRVAASGYAAAYSEEVLFASGTPQDAFKWWMNDKLHRDVILNLKSVDVGIGYAYLPGTAYGSYYTIDITAP
jgi:uncharacterized protein YkwD